MDVMTRSFFKAPVAVDLSITNACNLNCTYCYADASPQRYNKLDLPTISKLFLELSNMGVNYVRIAGGEPLLHPDIIKILEEACESPFITSMSTNGTLITKSISAKLKDMNFPWVVVSLDGHNSSVNNCTRGQWKQAENGIKYLLDAGVKCKTATVLTSRNANYISEMITYFENLGVYSAGFLLYCPVGRANGKDILEVSKSQLATVIKEISNYKSNTNHQMKVNFVPPHESEVPWELSEFLEESELKRIWGLTLPNDNYNRQLGCKAAISTCAIDSLGNVFGCEQLMGFAELSGGNINENSFKSIWENGSGLTTLRNIHFKDLDCTCVSCKNVGCGGGCRAVAYQHYKSLLKDDPRCKLI